MAIKKQNLFLLLGILCCFTVFAAVTGTLSAQTTGEICDNGIDDDKDKLVDCDDPDCADKCKVDGEPCSPGFWKNHTELWYGICCDEACSAKLLADLQARGPGSNAIRAAAADFLEECLGQPCNE